jgi:hypothetical protein
MFEKVCLVIQSKFRQVHAIRKLEHLKELATNASTIQKQVRKFNAIAELERLRIIHAERVRCSTIIEKYVRPQPKTQLHPPFLGIVLFATVHERLFLWLSSGPNCNVR